MLKSYFKLLRKRNFFLLWLGQIISQFGDRLGQMALIGLVYDKLGESSLGIAKTLFFTIAPVFLINPIAGIYIDRWGKKKTMVVSDFLRGVFILALGLFLVKFKTIIPIYVIIFLAYCVGRFFIPAKMAIIPTLVDEKDIVLANSLVSTTAMIAAVIGFGVGGIIVERLGSQGGFVFDAVTFFISSFLVFLIKIKPTGVFHMKDILDIGRDVIKREKSLVLEFKEGINSLFKDRAMRFSVKTMCLLFSFLGGLVVLISFVQQTFGSAVKHLGFLMVWLGVGLFVGSLLYGKISSKFSLSKTIKVMLFLTGLFLITFVSVLSRYPVTALASLFSFILGMIISPIIIGCNSLIHKQGDESVLGRVFSNLEVVMHFSFIVFMFIGSFLADIYSPVAIVIFISIIISLISLVSFFKNHD